MKCNLLLSVRDDLSDCPNQIYVRIAADEEGGPLDCGVPLISPFESVEHDKLADLLEGAAKSIRAALERAVVRRRPLVDALLLSDENGTPDVLWSWPPHKTA